MTDYREILTAEDVRPEHIEEAVSLRAGEYGGEVVPWNEVLDRIEASDEDWGQSMDTPAIRHLKREVGRILRESS